MKKRILFNCTTNNVGGGVKNSALFIKNALQDDAVDWCFAISTQVKEILEKWDVSTVTMCVFEISPARNKHSRNKIKKLALQKNIDMVFTMAGPAYVKFDVVHVIGISNPYITHVDYQGLSIGRKMSQILKILMLTFYQAYYSRFADYWMFQTEGSRKGYCKRFFVDKKSTRVISNTIGNDFVEYFKNHLPEPILLNGIPSVKIFCPAAPYIHKALHLIPDIAFELKKIANNNYRFEFILTISEDCELYKDIRLRVNQLKLGGYVTTIGPFNYVEAPKLYEKSNIIFVPSLLETFSASYLEAFASKKPLVVAEKVFARDICGNAALYIDPFEKKLTAKKIHNCIVSPDKQLEMIQNGSKVVKIYGLQTERYSKIIDYLQYVMVQQII